MKTIYMEFLAFVTGNPLIGLRYATTRIYLHEHGQRVAAVEQTQTNLQFVMNIFWKIYANSDIYLHYHLQLTHTCPLA